MKRKLDSLADQGCWISHDRVNAFISHREPGIAEIGYHGAQPVSKNSRIFVGGGGAVLSFVLRRGAGTEHPIRFDEVDWTPTSITVGDGDCQLQIVAFGRSIGFTVHTRVEARVELAFNLRSCNQVVHGTRRWSDPEILDSSLILSCCDKILLNEWLKRTGPYAGDFMIPEPTRRTIFARNVRSGEASVDDLRPEYRDAAIPIYDASVFVRMGGRDARIEKQDDMVTFVADASEHRDAEFLIQFGDRELDAGSYLPEKPRPSTVGSGRQTVSLDIPGYPAVGEFVETVPGLVDSAIIQDYGMPRATPAAYYWMWAWDSMVTGMEMLRWGDYATTRRMVEFINDHRDEGGLIPMRWTRALEPLDTPPCGGLEFLFASFIYQQVLETGDHRLLVDAYPNLVNHLREMERKSGAGGMIEGSGFYPDFPARFGRSGSSVVAMEASAQYAFARLMENISRLVADTETEAEAATMAARVEANFLEKFWDDETGFLIDSYDAQTGGVNKSYPLFTLLFLQSSLGIPLIRPKIDAMAEFCSEHLLGPFGTSLLPSWDRNRMNEDATSSWYPHWDAYLLKILRRGGRSAEIMQWLGNVECVLSRLGYCPEFIRLDDFHPDDPASWLNHGAVSNLNCVTGWFRAILEGLFGLELDPGGISVIPLRLPIDTLSLCHLVFRESRWNITVRNDGDHLEAIVIDGRRWEGICKVPARFYDGGEHSLEVLYGSDEPDLQFREIINAELIDSNESDDSRTIAVQPLGTCEVVFYSRGRPDFLIDGTSADFEFDERSGIGKARLSIEGRVDLSLAVRRDEQST